MTPRVCNVPRCGGRMIEKEVRGTKLSWCVACERRIEQLASIREKALTSETPARQPSLTPAAIIQNSPVAEISDESLLQLVTERFVILNDAPKLVKRSVNLVMQAQRAGKFAFAKFGRTIIVARRGLQAWSESYVPLHRGRPLPEWTEHIPRSAKKPLPAEELAKLSGTQLRTVEHWLRQHRADRRLKRVAIEYKGKARFGYWWHETPEPATEVQHA